MSEEGFNGKDKIPDADKDFGLPKVEIKPIQDEEKPKPLPQATEKREGNSETVSDGQQRAEVGSDSLPADNKHRVSWLTWLVLLLVFATLAAGGWFYLDNSQPKTRTEKPTENVVTENTVPVPDPVEEEVVEVSEEKPEEYILTAITARGEAPRYFLVVASFIDEDMARDHSAVLQRQGKHTFLVYPYGDIAYYRLAIGQFESFALASNEISRVKDNFEENLWVLKY